MEPLPRSFYERNPKVVAQELLGKIIVHRTIQGLLSAKIVETEAYFGPGDPASHAKTKTPRSAIMYGRAGHAYVYLNYGVHHLLNVVVEKEGKPGAILIRAVEPLERVDLMFKNRHTANLKELTSGPGKLTKALGIDISHNGVDLVTGKLFLAEGTAEKFSIIARRRVGLSNDHGKPLRYYIENNPFVSRK